MLVSLDLYTIPHTYTILAEPGKIVCSFTFLIVLLLVTCCVCNFNEREGGERGGRERERKRKRERGNTLISSFEESHASGNVFYPCVHAQYK